MRPHAIILLYHRVVDVDSDPQLLCVSPRFFEEHLEIISRHYRSINLQDLGKGLRGGHALQRSVAITFDDGYFENLYQAKPLLERYGVPATFFLTSGYIGEHREFWWDDLERLLLGPAQLPRDLRIMANGQVYVWDLGKSAIWTADMAQAHRGWDVTSSEVPTPRHEAYRTLQRLLKPLGSKKRSSVLEGLAKTTGVTVEGRSTHRALTSEEVRQLSQGELVEIGAHTVTHPQLSALSVKEQSWEILECRRSLENLINRPVVSFSYPFGSHGDFDNVAANLVRESGFQQACAAVPGVVTFKSDPFELPRLIVRNWDGDEFAKRIRSILGG
jgi:peptidoglycan/xylan/chitin deacetylase (PgdA/CDA1 family)